MGVAVGALVLLSACAGDDVTPAPPPPPPVDGAGLVGELIVVLPPADGLAEAERARIRLLVSRAIDAAQPSMDGATVPLLEPADDASLVDAVERAVRRVGAGGTVCILGADVAVRVARVFELYPATRSCLLPHPSEDEQGLAADVDLELLGRGLGAAARAAAGSGTVMVLVGTDPMLDRRWRAGVVAGAAERGDLPAPVHTLRSASDVLAFLEEQDALVAGGVVPGSPEARTQDDLSAARALAPVAVVVLDASREAELLLGALIARGLKVVVPRSLMLAAEAQAEGRAGAPEGTPAPGDAVVLRWRVRWDVPLAELVRRALSEGDLPAGPPGDVDEVLVLEPGPGSIGP